MAEDDQTVDVTQAVRDGVERKRPEILASYRALEAKQREGSLTKTEDQLLTTMGDLLRSTGGIPDTTDGPTTEAIEDAG